MFQAQTYNRMLRPWKGCSQATEPKPKDLQPTGKKAVTWEEQSKLAARMQALGVACGACLEGPFYLKSQ